MKWRDIAEMVEVDYWTRQRIYQRLGQYKAKGEGGVGIYSITALVFS